MSCGLYDVWLSLHMQPGESVHRSLFEVFGSAYDVYSADAGAYEAAGIPEPLAAKLCDKSLERPVAIMDYCTRAGVALATEGCDGYPARLADIANPPYLLYIRGKMPDIDSCVSISVVGTRSMSEYGKRAAYKISYELSAAGAVIVSGMALGIDSVAACAALDSGGQTVAVLGCGVDMAYPAQHKRLMDSIIAHGAVISEFAPGTRPDGRNFPLRNRIISGLGLGTLVVEADTQSGALITARTALVQGRDIFAIPGNIGETNADGTNALLRDGANMVLSSRDIIRVYEFPWRDSMDLTALAAAERISDYSGGLYERYGVSDGGQKPASASTAKRREDASQPSLSITYPRDRRSGGKNGDPTPAAAVKANAADGLEGKLRDVYEAMIPGEKMSIDRLMRSGFAMGELMSSLTQLEIRGLVSSVPGGLYLRK